jgi:hypothetical protein
MTSFIVSVRVLVNVGVQPLEAGRLLLVSFGAFENYFIDWRFRTVR